MSDKKISNLYVIRLTRKEVAMIVEFLTEMAQIEADNDMPEHAKSLKILIDKILKQASKGGKK